MKSIENQWNHEHLGNPVKINATQRKMINSSENLWNHMNINEHVWNQMKINEIQIKYMKSEASLKNEIVSLKSNVNPYIHWKSMKSNEKQWNHEHPGNPMRINAIQKNE